MDLLIIDDQVAVCPYCDNVVDESSVEYAGYIMHKECYEQFNREQEELGW